MANDNLRLGDWNCICDVCGFKFKASQMRKRWDGVMVCAKDYELRNPLDFLRVPVDNPSVPWSRPESTDVFVTGHITAENGNLLDTEDGDHIEW